MSTEETTPQGSLSREKVAKDLIGIISELLRQEVGAVNSTTGLEDELGLDSIHRVELSTRISHLYGLGIGVDDLDVVDTFGDLVDVVVSKVR